MITSISSPLTVTSPTMPVLPSQKPKEADGKQSFTGMVQGLLEHANQTQLDANKAVNNLASGKSEDIHQVMLAMEQARLSMLAVVEVRNKMIDAYQEISKMPV